MISPKKAVAFSSPSIPTTPSTSWLDQFFERFPLRLPIGYMDEISKLKRALRPEVIRLEAKAQRVVELETRVKEYERHCCPDAGTALKGENQQLKERIVFLERRVDALSKLTAPKLDDRHLVVNGS